MTNEEIKQKDRDKQYCAFLADIVQKYQRPRPDGSIDWNKAFVELLELKKEYIDLARAEEREKVVEFILNNVDDETRIDLESYTFIQRLTKNK